MDYSSTAENKRTRALARSSRVSNPHVTPLLPTSASSDVATKSMQVKTDPAAQPKLKREVSEKTIRISDAEVEKQQNVREGQVKARQLVGTVLKKIFSVLATVNNEFRSVFCTPVFDRDWAVSEDKNNGLLQPVVQTGEGLFEARLFLKKPDKPKTFRVSALYFCFVNNVSFRT